MMKCTKSLHSAAVLLGACLALTAAVAGCQDVNIKCVNNACAQALSAHDNKVQLSGTVCTVDPGTQTYPYKILFIIDVSGSTVESDPAGNRGAAVSQVVNQYLANPAVSFAVIDFSDVAEALVPNFTRDQAALTAAIPQLNRQLNNTNYLDALTLARQIIDQDAQATPEGERARTRYDIQFLSDGQPNPCQTPTQVFAAEKSLFQLQDLYSFYDMRLSTVELVFPNINGDVVPGCTTFSPDQYLRSMADNGRGSFQQLTSAQLKFNIDFSEIKRVFQQRNFYVVNESRVVSQNKLLPDSDRDGVSDADEIAQGTDPTRADAKNTGCGDRINQMLLPNQNLCSGICARNLKNGDPASLVDSDQDGLHDCEEEAIGSGRTKVDTDGDYLIDPLEVRFGTNVADPKTVTQDSDLDGVKDFQEVIEGTDPFSAESDRSLAYTYDPFKKAETTGKGVSCSTFGVHNVQLAQTLATPGSLAGDNTVCAYILQSTIDDPSGLPTVARACQTANYQVVQGTERKSPPNGTFHFEAKDFKPYLCPGGCK